MLLVCTRDSVGERGAVLAEACKPAVRVTRTKAFGTAMEQAAQESVTRPLEGIRVVALEHAVAAPLCTRHLAELGADVLKLERPDTGDFARGYDSAIRGQSAYFVWLNRGKRSVALDLRIKTDWETLDALICGADVFVHNFGPGAVERLGFAWTSLERRAPRLIDCEISGYGHDGPYRDRKAFDLLLQGEGGVMHVTGTPDAPARAGIPIADICGGMYALAAILAALVERERTGVGKFLEIAMLDGIAEWMMAPALYQRYGGGAPGRTGMRHNTIVPYGPFLTEDGAWVNLAVQTERQWQMLCVDVLGRRDLTVDSRYLSNEQRVRNRAILEPEIDQAVSALPRHVLVGRLAAADIPYGDVNDVNGLVNHPQLVARNRWVEIDTPGGPVLAAVSPLLQGPGPRRAVPAVGQHTAEVRRELRREVASRRRSQTNP